MTQRPRGQGVSALPLSLAIAMLMLVTPAAGRAADGQWQFGSSPSFSTGKYGSDARTEVLHTPITARRLFRDGDVSLVFPFTCIRGNGSVTVVNGSPVRQEPSTRPGAGAEAPRGTVAAEDTNCGMGDIIVRGRYYLVDEHGWMPTIAVRAHVKAPTASADRGLGTGRFDEGVGVEVSRTLAGQVLAMVDGGYTAIGRPTGVDYNNSWWYDLGAGRDIVRGAKGSINLSVFFEEYRTIVPGLADARDVLAAVTLTGTGGWRLQVSGQLGLSDGAPDHGIAIGASRRF